MQCIHGSFRPAESGFCVRTMQLQQLVPGFLVMGMATFGVGGGISLQNAMFTCGFLVNSGVAVGKLGHDCVTRISNSYNLLKCLICGNIFCKQNS
jgi:hypothetical protein